MKTEITGLIQEGGTVLGPITGAKSINGEAFTDVDTYDFTGPVETFDIDVNAAGTVIQLTTTGSFTSAWLILEG